MRSSKDKFQLRMVRTIYKFYFKNGLQFDFPNNQKLLIDGKSSKVPLNSQTIVTHAHSDHFTFMYSTPNTRATKETIDLFLCQKKPSGSIKFKPVNFNETIDFQSKLNDVDIQLLSSGHILGSASVLIEYNGKKILFTSDIGGKGQLTVKDPMIIPEADILIIEATFGSPELTFPSREEISMEILKWSADVIKEKNNVVFSAGKIGSAQELIKMYNNLTNLRVVTHGEVTPVSEVYQKHGVKLEFFDSKLRVSIGETPENTALLQEISPENQRRYEVKAADNKISLTYSILNIAFRKSP